MERRRVLVADDDADLRALVALVLDRAGYETVVAVDGDEAIDRFFAEQPDLVVLDVTMPGQDGWSVLARIRDASEVPVIMLTALATQVDTVRGLRGGADDYLTKPFGNAELVARVEAVLRRAAGRGPTRVEANVDDGVLRIDVAARRVVVAGRAVSLSPLEFRLLCVLARHPGEVFEPARLRELVWDDPSGVAREQVKTYIGYVRRKLAAVAPDGWAPIENVRGHGYRYAAPSGGNGDGAVPTEG